MSTALGFSQNSFLALQITENDSDKAKVTHEYLYSVTIISFKLSDLKVYHSFSIAYLII